MPSELMRIATGEVKAPRDRRKVARKAKDFFDDVEYTGLVVDGQVALAGHIMEKVVELDGLRRQLAGEDAALNIQLVDIQLNAIKNLKSTQDRLSGGTGWKL